MHFTLEHGMFKTFTGSGVIKDREKYAMATISGPLDVKIKEDFFKKMEIEVRIRHMKKVRSFENMTSALLENILDRYICREVEKYRSIIISVYTNTTDLSYITNSVLIACIDGGIPLKTMFYSFGEENLFVFSNKILDLKHITNFEILKADEVKAVKNFNYLVESVEYAFKNFFIYE